MKFRNMVKRYFFFIIALVLYICAPNIYSYSYCWILHIIFVCNALYTIRCRNEEIVGFNTLFSFAFYGVTYIYPIFIYRIAPNYSLFAYQIDDTIITKATALANIAYASYAMAYAKRRYTIYIENIKPVVPYKSLNAILFICIFLFVAKICTGGFQATKSMYSGESYAVNPIANFISILFGTFTLFTCIANYKNNKRSIYLTLLLICSTLLWSGGRRTVLSFLILFFYYLYEHYRFSLTSIIITAVIGVVLFSAIGDYRGGQEIGDVLSNSNVGAFEVAEDFIINSRNLYALYSYVQENSITYGISSLAYILAVIPFAQSIVSNLFGIPPYMMRSEMITTATAISEDSSLGLGTHIVGDVYVSFGLLGVILLFYFLGYVIRYSQRKMQSGIWSGIVIYLCLLANSIFMCRGAYFVSLQSICWVLFFTVIFRNIYKPQSKN